MIKNGEGIKKIAIMGGTFDPIHLGHLVSAETVRHEFGFDKVIFIPTGMPCHKDTNKVTDSEIRYLLTASAIDSNPNFEISRIEIDRLGPSYTIDTVREMQGIYGGEAELYFITGADALFQIFEWHEAEELLKICSFVAISRPGYDPKKLERLTSFLKNSMKTRLLFYEVPALAISSTDIRERTKAGMPIKYLVPDSVLSLVEKYNLYRG